MTTPELLTSRLVLRPFDVDDTERLVGIAGQRRIADATISVPHPFGEAEARAWIAQATDPGAADRAFVVARRDAPLRMIGYAGLRHVDLEHREGEISFWFDGVEEGNGYATESAGALVRYGFDRAGLNRLCACHQAQRSRYK